MEAWRKRESQQQGFIQKLYEKVVNAADDSGNYTVFMGEFSIALLRSINCTAGAKPVRDKNETEDLRDDILAEVDRFSRMDGEMVYLVSQLLEKTLVPIRSFSQQKYQHSCIYHSQPD